MIKVWVDLLDPKWRETVRALHFTDIGPNNPKLDFLCREMVIKAVDRLEYHKDRVPISGVEFRILTKAVSGVCVSGKEYRFEWEFKFYLKLVPIS